MLRDLDADLICLQEVSLAHRSLRPADQPAWLGDALGMRVLANPNWRRFRGSGGNALLTRLPCLHSEILRDHAGYRFAVAAVLELAHQPIAVVSAHFLWVPRPIITGVLVSIPRRSAQMRQALNWIKRSRRPAVLAGDFNALPYSPEYWTVSRRMTDCTRAVPINHRNTRPTLGLPAQLGNVFATRHFRTTACRTLDDFRSDHRPLVADLELSATPPASSVTTVTSNGSSTWKK